MKNIRFAVVQNGIAVFGVGYTADEAIADATKWLEPKNGRQGDMTTDEVRAELVDQPMQGDLCLISIDDDPERFEWYMESCDTVTKQGEHVYAEL